MSEDTNIVLTMDEETYYKLKFISEAEYPEVDSLIVHLVRECIEDFENKHGEIWL